jgi:ATP-binding cassette subfamily B protein
MRLLDAEARRDGGRSAARPAIHWRRSVRLLRPFFTRNWAALGGASGATILATAATLAQPWPLALVIDELVAVHDGAFELTGSDLSFLALIAGLVLGIAVVMATSEYFTDLWLNRAAERIVHDLRVALYGHLQRLSLVFHNRQQKGDLVTRVTGDVNAVGTLFSESLGEIVAAALLLIGMAVITFVLDPLLALATLAVVPVLFAVTVYYGRRVKTLARRQRREEGQIASLAAETLAAMPVVKAFGSEEYESDRVASLSAHRKEIGVEAAKAEARFSGLVEIIGAVARGLVLVLGVFRVAAGAISPGDLIVFVTYANKTYRPLRDIARQATKVSRAMARADRVAAVLAADQLLEEHSGPFGAGRAAGDVELERVSFRYAPDRPAVSDLSLRVPAGSRVALVGPSGAGKSTVGALLARLYDPDEGSVLIDGRDARECSLTWLRDQVGFLLQETMLFAGSVADNIEYAASGASREAVVQAAKTAGADEFIARLPQGYDTELGPSGIGLSGGQRQRIGIARVLLRDPAILILDEPTTGLDATSEDELIGGLERLMRGRTTLVITHSTGLARRADRVVVIAGGRVVEDGPPEQLLEELRIFREMVERQGMALAPGPSRPLGARQSLVP